MTSAGGRRFSGGGAWAATAVIGLAVVVLAGLLVHYLGRPTRQEPATAYPLPSSQASTPTPATTSAPGASPLCAPGRDRPLRQDTRFTADDAARTVVPYSISLPDDYYSACKQYPVIFALHGKTQNNVVFLDEALSMRKAMAAGVLEQSIIVTPDSYATGRWENQEEGPSEDNFIKQLIPFVEKNYRVRPGARSRLLVGFSMGGHGAIRFGLKYPQLFAGVWSVDGAMTATEEYLPYVKGRSSADFHIITAGGRANGDRVLRVVDGLKERGIEIPYIYQDLEHEFVAFVQADEKGGWQAMKYLQQSLVRAPAAVTSAG